MFEVNSFCIGWGNVFLLYKNINFVRLSVYISSICMIPISLYFSLIDSLYLEDVIALIALFCITVIHPLIRTAKIN